MRVDVMTDIETLGHKTDSTIFQIAAIAFDIETGEHLAKFNRIADIENEDTLSVTGSTLKWWLRTNKELLHDLLEKGEGTPEGLLQEFHDWLMYLKQEEDGFEDIHDLYLWGNGILFDNKMIQHQLEDMCLDYPINYKNDRDVRTIVDLASKKLGITEKELKAKFNDDNLVEHDAFDDVVYQINLVVECYKVLTE